MTELAAGPIAYFQADDREVHRDGWTFTADTLDTFPPGEEIVMILGSDAALGLPTWHRSGEVMSRVELAVVARPGVERAAVEERVKVAHWLDMPALPVSGTLIRDRVQSGQGHRFLVTEAVYSYVAEQGLYRD
jgi:nicotinate-nucleotide adenylyltransferase